MYELFLCHTCKSDPTILATFDYFLPGEKHGEHVSFRAMVEMVCQAQNNNRILILQTHVDINAVSIQDSLHSKSTDIGKTGYIGVLPKWNRTFAEFTEFGETDKSLKHEFGSI